MGLGVTGVAVLFCISLLILMVYLRRRATNRFSSQRYVDEYTLNILLPHSSSSNIMLDEFDGANDNQEQCKIARQYIQTVIIMAVNLLIAVREFHVQSTLKNKVPKSLIVPSCNLKLGETLGQGEFENGIPPCCMTAVAWLQVNLELCIREFSKRATWIQLETL